MLSEGLEMEGAFVEGDLSSVPVKGHAKAQGRDLSVLDFVKITIRFL